MNQLTNSNFCMRKPKTLCYVYKYSFMQSFYLQENYLSKSTKLLWPLNCPALPNNYVSVVGDTRAQYVLFSKPVGILPLLVLGVCLTLCSFEIIMVGFCGKLVLTN